MRASGLPRAGAQVAVRSVVWPAVELGSECANGMECGAATRRPLSRLRARATEGLISFVATVRITRLRQTSVMSQAGAETASGR